MNDGQIVFEVTADGKHAIADIKEITRTIQNETKKWDSATDKATGDMGSSFTSMLKKVGSAISAAAIAKKILDIGKACVEAASDLAEVQNVVEVTFGESSAEIDRWAKNAGAQFGLTETAAKRYASTIGAMMKSSGMAGGSITQMSKDLAGLAADMASFYNMDFDEAFQKIQSGISGQTMPLKSLGIDMSVATLSAFAMAEGMDKAFSEMSSGEQMLVRYKYLMKATADAQGDFARTSDGFANATRKVETQLENAKTKIGGVLLPIVEQALAGFNSIMDMLLDDSGRTVLDDFAEIDKKLAEETAAIAHTRYDAESLVKVMSGIYAPPSGMTGTAELIQAVGDAASDAAPSISDFGAAIADILASQGVGDSTTQMLEDLGYSTEEITDKNRLWLETCKRLADTIPGLSGIINTETGAIDGGRVAVEDYIKSWEEGQKKLAYMRAQERRKRALEDKYAELPTLQLDMDVAQMHLGEARSKLSAIVEEYALSPEKIAEMAKKSALAVKDNPLDTLVGIAQLRKGSFMYNQAMQALGLEGDQAEMLFKLASAYADSSALAKKATDAYTVQHEAYLEGLKIIEEGDRYIEGMAGDVDTYTDAATEATAAFWEENKEGAKQAVENAEEALKTLADYAQSVHDAVASAVDSVITGFNHIKSPVGELETQRSKLIEEQLALDSSASDYKKKWEEIEKKIQEINGQIREYKPAGMMEGLQSQLSFMEQYTANLQAAQRLGLSSEFLASLSDGSVESAEYLAQLVADPEAAKKVDAMWQQVQAEKKKFTDTLTAQQLDGDAVYQSLAESARQAVSELDLYSAAVENSGHTVEGVAKGISDHLPEVEEAVNSILAEMSRLSGFNIGIEFGTVGNTFANDTKPTITKPGKKNSGGAVDGDFAIGLDYVPFDGFLASLHAGEGILTEQENRIWQRFKAGGSGIDYETMGGVMRDNIKPGGNVYLDGRIVGSVVSDQQGKAFRQLKRSGWQG